MAEYCSTVAQNATKINAYYKNVVCEENEKK